LPPHDQAAKSGLPEQAIQKRSQKGALSALERKGPDLHGRGRSKTASKQSAVGGWLLSIAYLFCRKAITLKPLGYLPHWPRDENSRHVSELEGEACRIQFDSTKSGGSALFLGLVQRLNPSLLR
jgi:hypothetical protein